MPADPGSRLDHSKVVTDVETLKALAHPLRMRLLARLRLHGPATASALGRTLDETSGATSYHLRQLQRYGFVEPAAEQPSRRDKVWQASHGSTRLEIPEADDLDWTAAYDAVLAGQLDALLSGKRRWMAGRARWPRAWQEAQVSTDLWVRVTPAALAALKQTLLAAVEAAETPDDPDARLISVQLHSYPEEGEQP